MTSKEPDCRMNQRPAIPAKLVPAKAGSGNPETFTLEVDSRFRGACPRFRGE